MDVFVLGRFPPPLDGQSMATQRLAELLAPSHTVHCLNTEPPAGDYVVAETRLRLDRVWHYLKLRASVREALREAPSAPVLWPSISPHPLGHWRDVLTVAPAFQPGQSVWAVVHRATLHTLFESPTTALTARRLVNRLQGLVFLTESIAERCAPWIPAEKRRVIPNTLDEAVCCDAAEVAAKQRRAPGRPLRLLFLSNMMPEKGYLDVLHAVRLLHARGVAVHAHFAGGWVQEADRLAFERLIAAERLHDVVTHHGRLTDRATVKALHLSADVFLLPSYHPTEAMPLVLIEALNAGTPVITTRHGGIPEMVRDDAEALFVPPRDPDAIAAAVERLATPDRWNAFSEHARQRFSTHFSPTAVRRQWEHLLGPDA